MPSLRKKFSVDTLKSLFGKGTSGEHVRKSSSSHASTRSESLPPDTMRRAPTEHDRSGLGQSYSVDIVPASNQSSPPTSFHYRSATAPVALDMPTPDHSGSISYLDHPEPIPYVMASPDSFSSSLGPPSTLASPPMSPPIQMALSGPISPPAFSPLMNLHVQGIIAQVDQGPQNTKTEKILNKIDDKVSSASDPKGLISVGISAVKTVAESSGALKAIEAGINAFVDDIPWLMKGLDEVAKIHPFVRVPILAFKAVYTMEVTRRENDKRIRSLYVEMKEMIAVLIQLKDVNDPQDIGPGGITISARMQTLCVKAADDIKDCANVCDSYAKKRLVVKILRGHTWETKLVGFADTFNQRKTEFQQALTIHTARTVDAVHSTVQTIESKLDLFMKYFAANVPHNEEVVRAKIRERGTDYNALLNNDEALKQLNKFENDNFQRAGNEYSNQEMRSEFSLEDLKAELLEDFNQALETNFKTFERKFILHHNQLSEQLERSKQEIIVAVREGPHDKIKNPELKEIWKEMNWRRNVKANLFVMTVRDHFREKGEENISGIEALADWTLKYIDTTWLQSIMEAFDDDASGYVTVVELNRFTDAKPESLKWSLPHWIAYWAVGWQLTTRKYKTQIEDILAKMYSMVPYLLPENRRWAGYYLFVVFKFVAQVIYGLEYPNEAPEYLEEKFSAYVTYEEDRIRKSLELVKYDIDAVDTVQVIANGRIEKHILPMIYLLLSRDLKLFRVGQTKILHEEELWDAADSLMWVNTAALYRVQDLTELFKQRKLDPEIQFKKFAYGMLKYTYNTMPLWTMAKIIKREPYLRFATYTFDQLNEEPEPNLDDVLNYPLQERYYIADDAFSVHTNAGAAKIPLEVPETNLVNLIKGTWNGFAYQPGVFPSSTMETYHFNPDSTDQATFSCDCVGHKLDYGRYKLSGSCSRDEDGTIRVNFQLAIEGGSTQYNVGHIDNSDSFVGYRSWSEDVSAEKHDTMIIFRRVSQEVMQHRPSPEELGSDRTKYRALWQFAINFTLQEVRKKWWSWSYFSERRDIRKLYIKLNINYWTYGRSLTDEEAEIFLKCRRRLAPSESLLYRSIRGHVVNTIPMHHPLICDYCGNTFGGCRFICLDCPTPDVEFGSTCDADDLACFGVVYDRLRWGSQKPHRPNHDIVKLRTVIDYHDIPRIFYSGWDSLEHARAYFEEPSDRAHEEVLPQTNNQDVHNSKANGVQDAHDNHDASTSSSEAESVDAAQIQTQPTVVESAAQVTEKGEAGGGTEEPRVTLEEGVTLSEPEVHSVRPRCQVCSKEVTMPCWYCTECPSLFLCDDCEDKTLLICVACKRPYTQPSWYYGGGPNDNFLCNTCNAKKVTPPEIEKTLQHVYTHPLVRCKPKVHDPVEETVPTAEERITALEQRMNEKLARMERALATMQDSVQQLLARPPSHGQSNGSARPVL